MTSPNPIWATTVESRRTSKVRGDILSTMKECFKVLIETHPTHAAIHRNLKIYQYYPQNKISSEHMKRAASYLREVEAWVVIAVPWQPHHKFFAINRQIQILIISF